MKTIIQSMAGCAMLAALAIGAQTAQAGCNATQAAGFKPTVFQQASSGRFIRTDFRSDAEFREGAPFNTAGITGMYEFEWWAPIGPGGANVLFDSGFVTLHDDGTELNNSARPAVTGNFCEGVWKQTGPDTYEINHWGLSWVTDGPPTGYAGGDPNSAFTFAGPANILETLTLAKDGNSFSGTFTLTQYLAKAGGAAFDTSAGAAPGYPIAGTIKACRVVPGSVQPKCPYWMVTQ